MSSSLPSVRSGARRPRLLLGSSIALGAIALATGDAHASPPSPVEPCLGTEYDLREILATGDVPDPHFETVPGLDLDDGSVRILHGAFAAVFPDGIPFFGERTEIYANANGNLTFGAPLGSVTEDALPGLAHPTIAAFFGDVDFDEGLPDPVGRWTMCVDPGSDRVLFTWTDVAYFDAGTDKRNTFQVALVDNDENCTSAHNFALELRYERIEWTTGDAEGGVNGLGGLPAAAGIDAGDGLAAVALEGSGTAEMLDLASGSNVGEPGVYRFLVTQAGLPTCGDGTVDLCEVCDDGNADDGDACSNTCQLPSCADPFGCDPPQVDACAGIVCGAHATCSTGHEAELAGCVCDAGYAGDGDVCVDVDECEGAAACGAHETCVNLDGGYRCDCDDGFVEDAGICVDIDECLGKDVCGANANCDNTVGGYVCSCNPGFIGDGQHCEDVDECESSADCGPHAECRNQPGGYYCTCDDGFRASADGCVDIDECHEGSADCSPQATCTNKAGRFDCACDPGFDGDGVTCADIDECSDGAACGPDATCVNDFGSHHCACQPDFRFDGDDCVPAEEGTGGGGAGGAGDGGGGGDGDGGGGDGGSEAGSGGDAPRDGVRRPGPRATVDGDHPTSPPGGAGGGAGGASDAAGAGGQTIGDGPGMTASLPGAVMCSATHGEGGLSGAATLVAAAVVFVSRRRRS